MLAHRLDSGSRTQDVTIVENVTFESMLFSEKVLKGLKEQGYIKPSPVQLKALPVGRCGFDLIVKSKSGTGKTLVYSILALESLKLTSSKCEVLILAPTREIAVQSQQVIQGIGSFFENLKVECFIGGLSVAEDKEKCKKCHIAVGTPGRIIHLIKEDVLKLDAVRLFVLDEADKLMEDSFRNNINEIYNKLSVKKQMITTSATYPNQLDEFLSKYMLAPTHVTAELESPLLLGLKQFVVVTEPTTLVSVMMKMKTERLMNILSSISFTQCLIFSNYQSRTESLCNILNANSWPSTFISAAQTQKERLAAVAKLKKFKCRIMLSTDLTSRGIDAANVDLVINYDIPVDAMTYLHRMGRAGRFGTKGACINLASEGEELTQLQEIIGYIGGSTLAIPKLPEFTGQLSALLEIEIPPEEYIPSIINEEKIKEEHEKNKKVRGKDKNKEDDDNVEEENKKDSNNEKTTETKIEEKVDHVLSETKKKDQTIKKQVKDMDTSTILGNKKKTMTEIKKKIISALNETKKDVETIKKQVKDMDASTILDSLLNDKFMIEDESGDTTGKTDKLNTEKSSASHIQKKSSGSRDDILTKNTALLNITKILSGNHSGDAVSIEKHLSAIKSTEKQQLNRLAKKNVSDILNFIKNPDIEQINTINSVTGDVDTSRDVDDDATGGSEDLSLDNFFDFGYRHLVKSNSNAWKPAIARLKKPRMEEPQKTYEIPDEITEESCDEEYEECEEYQEGEEYYEATAEEEKSENDDNKCEVQVPEYGKRKKRDSDKCVPNAGTEDAHMVGDSKSYYEQWDSISKTAASYGVTQTCVAEMNKTNDQESEYYEHFKSCGDTLWYHGLNFDNVESFNEWFDYEWQPQLASVRNFVQQRIYMDEMMKYKNPK